MLFPCTKRGTIIQWLTLSGLLFNIAVKCLSNMAWILLKLLIVHRDTRCGAVVDHLLEPLIAVKKRNDANWSNKNCTF